MLLKFTTCKMQPWRVCSYDHETRSILKNFASIANKNQETVSWQSFHEEFRASFSSSQAHKWFPWYPGRRLHYPISEHCSHHEKSIFCYNFQIPSKCLSQTMRHVLGKKKTAWTTLLGFWFSYRIQIQSRGRIFYHPTHREWNEWTVCRHTQDHSRL